jgi:hypothetical protein
LSSLPHRRLRLRHLGCDVQPTLCGTGPDGDASLLLSSRAGKQGTLRNRGQADPGGSGRAGPRLRARRRSLSRRLLRAFGMELLCGHLSTSTSSRSGCGRGRVSHLALLGRRSKLQCRVSQRRRVCRALSEIFEEAVRYRLRSTKPVGIFLSGGIDSGSTASMAGSLFQREGAALSPAFRAYCWGWEELPWCDERHISSRIAEHYGFPVTELSVDEAWPLKD